VNAAPDDPRRLLEAPDAAAFLARWLERDWLGPPEGPTLAAYYVSFRRGFSARMRDYYAGQLREVEALVAARPGLRMLEVGCGCGTESLWLALQGADVLGLDVRGDRVAVARRRAALLSAVRGERLAARFERTNLLDLDVDARFDAIWMEQAFHHLEPRADVVARLFSLLQPGGTLIVSEANGWNPLLQAQLLLRRGPRLVTTYRDEDGAVRPYGNERVLSAAALTRLLGRAGIRRRSVRHFRVFPNHPLFDRLGGLERQLARNALAPLATHYNWVGERVG